MRSSFAKPRGMEEARRRAFALPASRPSVAELPYPVVPSDPESEYLDWLPKPILGKVHQSVPAGKHGPTREWRTGEEASALPIVNWRRPARRKATVYTFGPDGHVPPEPKPRKVRVKVRDIMQEPGVEPDPEPVATVAAPEVAYDATRGAVVAPAITVQSLARRIDAANAAPRSYAERRAAVKAVRGW